MKTKCYATLNRFGFELISSGGAPFIACTDRRGTWQHGNCGRSCFKGKRHCVHHEHVPERVGAPQAGTVGEAPQIPLALNPA